ncbi:MAG: HPr family phosphocarrier protein [Tissierellaceae bacterium]|jgi:phosphocarrier protein
MYKEEVVLKNETGLHARPASLFVKEASKYVSDIKIIKDEKEYNAKSIMGILSMGAAKGDLLTIQAEGEDEELAVKTLIDLISNKLND